MKIRILSSAITGLLASVLTALALPIHGPATKISITCPDVVLQWPSTPGQSYLVQHRPDLNPGTRWTTLTNYLLASLTTNETIFVHSNQVQCPAGGMAALASQSQPQAYSASLVDAVLSGANYYVLDPIPMPPVKTNGVWLPWEDVFGPLPEIKLPIRQALRDRVWAAAVQGTLQILSPPPTDGPTSDSPDPDGPPPLGPSPTSMGFYRVIEVSPVAGLDVFGVEQFSSANQLDILKNDADPNDDRLLISEVTSPGHGSIQYTPDGSMFQYTPDTDFWGTDSFTYTITNFHRSSATAVATVFVNQSGNQRPLAVDLTFALDTNVFSVAFNALTNATDNDNDTLTLFAVTMPRIGTAATNSTSDVLYTRAATAFGPDSFTYVVTDGKGGHALGTVNVHQIDSDADGIPDQWEIANSLDPFADDSALDPDTDTLPNLAEYLLRSNPHLSDNPLSLELTNGSVLTGFAQIALSAINPYADQLPLSLFANGEMARNSFLSQGPDGQWFLNWNTQLMTNGTYTLKPVMQYNSETADGLLSGPSVQVQVTNLIVFDYMTRVFSDFLVIDGRLPQNNATVTVHLYDEYDSPLVYGTFAVTNGHLFLGWDLTDGNGRQIAFASIHGKFDVTLTGQGFGPMDAGGDPTTVWEWFLKGRTPGPGNTFVCAWGWDSYGSSFNSHREQLMLDGVVNILGNPGNPDAYFLAPSANVPFTTAFRFDNTADKQSLTNALGQNQNFFWFGHGTYNGFYGNRHRADVGPTDIEKLLQNFAYKSRPNHPKEDKHQYRLVILNACETYSSLWAGVFGIPFTGQSSTSTTLDYQYTGQMPRAFVGWTNVITVPTASDAGWLLHAEYALMLGEFFSKWMSGYPLEYCLDFYEDKALYFGIDGHDSWHISGCKDLTRW